MLVVQVLGAIIGSAIVRGLTPDDDRDDSLLGSNVFVRTPGNTKDRAFGGTAPLTLPTLTSLYLSATILISNGTLFVGSGRYIFVGAVGTDTIFSGPTAFLCIVCTPRNVLDVLEASIQALYTKPLWVYVMFLQ